MGDALPGAVQLLAEPRDFFEQGLEGGADGGGKLGLGEAEEMRFIDGFGTGRLLGSGHRRGLADLGDLGHGTRCNDASRAGNDLVTNSHLAASPRSRTSTCSAA